MDVFWFWFLMLMLVIVIFAWPSWPYTHDRWVYRRESRWRYGPSGVAAALAVLLFLLFWFGLLAIWWPWYAPPPAAV